MKKIRVNLALSEEDYELLRKEAFDKKIRPTSLATMIVCWHLNRDGKPLQAAEHPVSKTGKRLRIDYKNSCEEVEL